MSGRLAVAAGVVGAAAAVAVGGLYAGGGRQGRPPSGACREWVAAPAFRRAIAVARTLVPKLLGAAVEAAAGAPFARAVDRAVSRPLGMRSTRLGTAAAAGDTRFYEVTAARRAVLAPRIDLSDRYPSGGFLSTAEDLVRLGVGLTDPQFLDRRSRRLLFTSQRTNGGEATGYAFGLEVHDSPCGVFAGHTGNVVGGTSFLLVHPRTRVSSHWRRISASSRRQTLRI
jgi:CubicO group peptidase (beta-lactamase class C family)